MTISERYREIAREVQHFLETLSEEGEAGKARAEMVRSEQTLAEWLEQVGDVPRMHLEAKLTPVLLKAHNQIDRARLLFEEAGQSAPAKRCWALQQNIYRLLNDL